jgi:phage gp29-like protein
MTTIKKARTTVNLKSASTSPQIAKNRKDGFFTKIAPKAISQARSDIAIWKAALRQAMLVDNPKRYKLHNLYKDIQIDSLLTSQIENRKMQTLGSAFTLKDQGGSINEEMTALLKSSRFYYDLVKNMLDAVYAGTTIVEFISDANGLRVITIPRNNIQPEKGVLLYDETADSGIDFRNAKEYGTWLLEFGEPTEFGLLNKSIPHVLFKRFAQSCWSELCEIYGIPPRVMKTNTGDPVMLTRAEQMMRDMGAAAWFIIDETESFEFAKASDTNGDVYSNLIRLCNNEISLLISGAVIGQDTKNGNESKENISVGMYHNLVNADKRMVEGYFNSLVLPALYLIGAIPDGLTFEFAPQEDISALWKMTNEAMQHMEVDPVWVKTKFGIEVLGAKTQPQGKAALSFFD